MKHCYATATAIRYTCAYKFTARVKSRRVFHSIEIADIYVRARAAKKFCNPWRLHYPDMRPNFKSSLRLKYSRYFRFESHPRAQETKMAAGEKVRAESDAADPGYSAAGRACQTERFARFCLRIDFARGCCYMD